MPTLSCAASENEDEGVAGPRAEDVYSLQNVQYQAIPTKTNRFFDESEKYDSGEEGVLGALWPVTLRRHAQRRGHMSEPTLVLFEAVDVLGQLSRCQMPVPRIARRPSQLSAPQSQRWHSVEETLPMGSVVAGVDFARVQLGRSQLESSVSLDQANSTLSK